MSMAKMYIRGLKEPLLITVEQAEKVNKVLEDTTIPEESRINVANGKWVGAKRLINYVTFETQSFKDGEKKTFNKDDVDRWRSEVDTFHGGKPRTKNSMLEFYEKKGAIRIEKFMSEVPGIGEIWTPIIKNVAVYAHMREIEDFVEELDHRAYHGERQNDEKLMQSIDKVKDKMTLK